MSQEIINYGAAANDGQGDPLRVAFIKTDNNFDQIWAAGPVGSNITILNNTIQVTNTNGNLELATNGTGVISTRNHVRPSLSQVYDLGTANLRYRTVYANTSNLQSLSVTSDVTIGGNLTVTGNTIQIGNITTETKTIQLANSASTANAANGSGVTVGANDNIATMLYSSTSNTWVMNIGANVTGNVTAPYFIGNGSQLTGITSYANANAVAYGQAGWAGNIIPATSNVYSLGNSTNQWSDLYVSNATIYMNNVPISLTAGNVLTVNGEDVLVTNANGTVDLANLAIDNNNIYNANGQGVVISNFSFIAESETAYVQIPAGNSASDLSIVQEQGNVRIAASAADWTFDTTGNLTLPNGGNINEFSGQTARFQAINEDGQSQAALLVNSNYGLVRLESFDNQSSGSFSTADWATGEYTDGGGYGAISFTDAPTIINFFSTVDTSRVFYQVNGGNLLPSSGWGSGGNNIVFYTDIVPASSPETVNNFTIYYSDRSIIEMDYDEGTMNLQSTGLDINIQSDQSIDIITNDIIRLENYGNSSGVAIITDAGNAFHTWNFQPTGNLTLPSQGNIVGSTPNNAGYLQWLGNSSGDLNGYTTLRLVPDDTLTGNDQYLIIDPTAPGHIHIRAGGTQDNSNADLFLGGENTYFKVNAGANSEARISANSHSWVFGQDAILTVPGEGVIRSIQDTVILQSYDLYGNTYSARLGTNGGLYFETTDYPGGWLSLTNDLGNANISSPSGNINITSELNVAGNVTANYFIGNGSQLTGLPASYSDANVVTFLAAYGSNNISTTGNITAGNFIGAGSNVELVAQSAQWIFDTTGNLTVAGNIVMPGGASLVGDGASPAPNINGFDSVSAVTFSASGNITTTATVSGKLLYATQSAPNEGGEIQLALPSSGTTLTGNIVIDSYQNQIRLFESTNSRGLYVDVPNVSVSGQYAIGYRDVPQLALSGNVTANSITAGKHFYSTTAGNLQITIPDNANVAFPLGATLTVVVNAEGNVIVAQGTGVSLYMAGSSTTGNRTVGAYGLASVMKVATDTWVISGTGVY